MRAVMVGTIVSMLALVLAPATSSASAPVNRSLTPTEARAEVVRHLDALAKRARHHGHVAIAEGLRHNEQHLDDVLSGVDHGAGEKVQAVTDRGTTTYRIANGSQVTLWSDSVRIRNASTHPAMHGSVHDVEVGSTLSFSRAVLTEPQTGRRHKRTLISVRGEDGVVHAKVHGATTADDDATLTAPQPQ